MNSGNFGGLQQKNKNRELLNLLENLKNQQNDLRRKLRETNPSSEQPLKSLRLRFNAL